ncbi:MAG: hypothetical protein P9F75_01680 [Candidatus Contendobacter sp.]|nr:hypothetical protein [Candidatus Contendobacter sp.]
MSGHPTTSRILLGALATGLAWFSLAAGLGGFFAQQAKLGEEDAIDRALAWQPRHPDALFGKALALLSTDPVAAEQLLAQAFRANGGDPWPLVVLATRRAETGQWQQADALMDEVARLAPADLNVQLGIAAYWATRSRLDRVLSHWSVVLAADDARQKELFPVLLRLVETPETRELFKPLTQSPPPWWQVFFAYVAAKALDQDSLRFLFLLRQRATDQPLTREERQVYVARLQREGLIAEAYLTWVDGLNAAEREHLGRLFDGSFDLPLVPRNFGWQLAENEHFTARPARTQGIKGLTALRLRFRGYDGPFARLGQPLFLDPGLYRLSGWVRLDSLASKGGLRWQVRCLLPEEKMLANGPRFLGSASWSIFDLRFEVPAACRYQQLSLVSASDRAFEQKLNGTVWFDDLKITRVSELDAASRADALTREGE